MSPQVYMFQLDIIMYHVIQDDIVQNMSKLTTCYTFLPHTCKLSSADALWKLAYITLYQSVVSILFILASDILIGSNIRSQEKI